MRRKSKHYNFSWKRIFFYTLNNFDANGYFFVFDLEFYFFFSLLQNALIFFLQASCMFWMPAQAINFALVPPTLRVVYIGTCSFLWVNILCILKRGNKEEKSE